MKLPGRKKTILKAIPARETISHTGIVRDALRHKLTARHKEGGTKLRADILEIFKSELARALDKAKELFMAGRLGGLEMARMISAIHDLSLIHI